MREQFEKLFPVPKFALWSEVKGRYVADDRHSDADLVVYNGAWKGFQAGHAAGLEDACTVMRANFTRDMADEMQEAIRAMKGEAK